MHIPVTKGTSSPHAPHIADKVDAPYISGEFDIVGHRRVVSVMVDTGADFTLLNVANILDARTIWELGEEGEASGVGGKWPMRKFKDCRLIILTDSGEQVALAVPRLSLSAAYIVTRRGAKPKIYFNKPGQNMGQVDENPNPNLLGRDIFIRNKLQLNWDPNGESRILFSSPPARTIAPAEAASARVAGGSQAG